MADCLVLCKALEVNDSQYLPEFFVDRAENGSVKIDFAVVVSWLALSY